MILPIACSSKQQQQQQQKAEAARERELQGGGRGLVRLRFRRSPFGDTDHVLRVGLGRSVHSLKQPLVDKVYSDTGIKREDSGLSETGAELEFLVSLSVVGVRVSE